jgi:hypothetical protein
MGRPSHRRVLRVTVRLSTAVFKKGGKDEGIDGRRDAHDDFERIDRAPAAVERGRKVILRRAEECDGSSFVQPLKDAAEMKVQLSRATDTLAELCELLKEYGPRWYSERQQERAESTLRLLRKN